MSTRTRELWLPAAALVGSWAAFAASVLWRPHPGEYSAGFDAGLYNVPFALAAWACWRRGGQDDRARSGWRVLAAGLALFTAANVYSSLLAGEAEGPTAADAAWLTFYLVVYVAVGLMVKARTAGFLPSTWLDGAVGGFGVAALAVAFALGPVLEQTQGTVVAVTVNLAYPIADILLVVVLVASANVVGAREAAWWLLALGIGAICAGDIGYLFADSAGVYAEGGLLDLSWPLGAVAIGLGALVRPTAHRPRQDASPRHVVPAVFALTSLALLVVGQWQPLPPAAVGLAVAALAATTARVTLTFREVTRLADSRREARTDDLTGLANRRRLLEHLTEQLVSCLTDDRPCSLVVLDLDRFKEVNDSLGHGAGDRLLEAVGARFAEVVAAPSLLARMGGDEFAVVLPGHDRSQALQVAERLRRVLHEPVTVDSLRIPVDASLGVATAPDHAPTAEALMTCADIAMYQAKRGRTRVAAYRAGQDQPTAARISLLAELHTALAEGQLTLWYQPQLNLATGLVCGVESLVRWMHPRRGLLAPDAFLPLAEQSNLMPEVTSFVLARTLADCRWLADAGFPLRVSVNVSATDLIDSTLPELVALHLQALGLDPQMLVVEVTEDTVMADRVRALQVLQRLRAARVQVAVDDYGTGQSSLSYLRDLPISEIKLDRTFLTGVPDDTHNAAIVRSTIELAHALDLPIVAEGVEDAAALAWLRETGCDIGQGFHIARPMPMTRLVPWLEAAAQGVGTGGDPDVRGSRPGSRPGPAAHPS